MLKNLEITTDAVIIGRASSGEGSVRAYLYTEALGLVGALAKSAREERSKLRPHLQVGTYGTFTLVKGSHGWRVIGASQTVSAHFMCSEMTHAQHACARILSVLRQLIHGEEPSRELFVALWRFLASMNTVDEAEAHIAERLAMVRILTSLGYVPAQHDIPHLLNGAYDPSTLRDLAPYERRLVKIINEALLASGLS